MGELRIGDAERERALAALGEHFAQGRLAREEYDERADAVWTARTAGDLRPLFADLPPQPGQGSPVAERRTPPAPAARAQRARTTFGGLPTPVKVLLGVLAAFLVVSHLPLILLAGVLWFVLSRHGHVGRPPWASYDRRRQARGW